MMTDEKLLEKSKEAFILAVEIYNKPTIKYRVEGFAFFICNAWELMLKSHLIKTKGENSIYYKDNPTRTINLENCIKLVFTNENDPLRKNLEKIIELRNVSTHFITEEYEMVYVPLFQACLFNFSEKMQKFHSIDVTELISQNFLNLVVKEKSLDENEIKAKYSDKIAQKLIGLNDKIMELAQTNGGSHFAIPIEHTHYITKNKDKATDIIAIDKAAETRGIVLNKLQNPNQTHPFTAKKVCESVSMRIKKAGLHVKCKDSDILKFNSYHFRLFCDYFSIKNNEKWCFVNNVFGAQYSYSASLIDFIFDEIKKDCNILNAIKEKLKKS